MENTELIEHLIKEHSFKVDYPNGSKSYDIGENDLKHIAQLIVKKFNYTPCCTELKALLQKLLEENMCSHTGDELINETLKKL